MRQIFRFAPTSNGYLHLGHAFSALLNAERAKEEDGRFLLRIEDIDISRCRPHYEAAIYEDLAWLGLGWEEPVRRQSKHIDTYRQALDRLITSGLAYPAFLSRMEIKARVAQAEAEGAIWPRDPDGAPHYPTQERDMDPSQSAELIAQGARHMWRLNMSKALSTIDDPLLWHERERGLVKAHPEQWGDVVLWRWDAPSSYHLSVVVDDAIQGVTHVVRGMDLYEATSVHRVLQVLLDLRPPLYDHHRLLVNDEGHKLSKSLASTSIRQLRAQGMTLLDFRRRVGLD